MLSEGCVSPRGNTPHSACAQGFVLLGGSDHMEDDDQDRGDEENGQKVETVEREEEVNG